MLHIAAVAKGTNRMEVQRVKGDLQVFKVILGRHLQIARMIQWFDNSPFWLV